MLKDIMTKLLDGDNFEDALNLLEEQGNTYLKDKIKQIKERYYTLDSAGRRFFVK